METLTCKGMWTGPAESQFQPFQNDEEEQSHLDYFGKLFIYYVIKRNMAVGLILEWPLKLHFFLQSAKAAELLSMTISSI